MHFESKQIVDALRTSCTHIEHVCHATYHMEGGQIPI